MEKKHTTPTQTPTNPQKVLYNLQEFKETTGISRSSILNLIAEGLPFFQVKKRSPLRFSQESFDWLFERYLHNGQKPRRGRPPKYNQQQGSGGAK